MENLRVEARSVQYQDMDPSWPLLSDAIVLVHHDDENCWSKPYQVEGTNVQRSEAIEIIPHNRPLETLQSSLAHAWSCGNSITLEDTIPPADLAQNLFIDTTQTAPPRDAHPIQIQEETTSRRQIAPADDAVHVQIQEDVALMSVKYDTVPIQSQGKEDHTDGRGVVHNHVEEIKHQEGLEVSTLTTRHNVLDDNPINQSPQQIDLAIQ
jgi:hypothetical protein